MKKWLMILACLMAVSVLKAETVTWDLITTATFQSLTQYQMTSDGVTTYLIGRGTFRPPMTYKVEGNKTVNGVNWQPLSTNLSLVLLDDIVYYNGYVYAIGGKTVAKSLDGNNWTNLTEGADLGTINNSVGIFNNKMVAIYQNSVFQSIDGIDWETLTGNAGFAVTTTACNLVEFNNKLWRFSGTENNDTYIYNTDNGVDWVVVTGNAFYGTHPIKVTADANYIYGYDTLSDYMFKTTDGIDITPYDNEGDSIDSSVDQMFIINGYFFLISPSEGQVYFASIPEQLSTETPTITPSFTALPTVETETPSITPTSTATTTKTVTKTITATHSITKTITATRTVSPTWTSSNTNTPTRTITPTRTNTPLTTPTVTVTVTPILTLEPILRYVSTDYDNHKTTLRLEWTKYDDNALQYYLTVYDRTYQHESTTVLSNLADISPDLEWLTHDLIGLRYDYCYNIGLTITSSNWSEPVYADTIVICPYESPTPPSFETYTPSHTPTAVWTQQDNITIANLTPQNTQIPIPTGVAIISEPTPEWTQVQPLATVWVYMINWPTPIPTATATATTAYTLTRTTLGLLKYDDFEDGIAGAVYNAAIYTANSGTFTYRARPGSAGIGPLGNISLEYTNNANIYLGVSTVADVSYRLSAWIYIAGGRKHAMYAQNGRNAWFSGQQFSVGNFATYNRVWLPNITYAGNWFFYDGYFPDGAAPDSNYGLSCNFYTADSGNALTHLNPTLLGSGIYNIGLDSSTEENLGYIRFQVDSAAAGALYDNVCVELGRFVLFSGLTPGYRVDIIDANTLRPVRRVKRPTIREPLTSVVDVGDNYCKIDLMGNTPGREVYIRIYDTNNILISTTGPTQVWGGDVWELTTP